MGILNASGTESGVAQAPAAGKVLADLPVRPANAQHKGQREAQQDAFGFSALNDAAFARHGGYLAVLADGMGGLQNGVWASTRGVRAFRDAYAAKAPAEPIAQALSRALRLANAVVHDEAERLDLLGDMGSTLVAAVVHDMSLHWINAGDSRVYLFEAGRLMCLSTDHNYGEKLKHDVLKGLMSASEAAAHPARNSLTSNLGRPEPLMFDSSPAPIRLSPGAWVLLCSDGLSGVLADAEISRELYGDPQQACDRLLNAAIGRGLRNQDNTTVVVFHIPKADGVPQQATRSRAIYPASASADDRTRLMRLVPPIGGVLCAGLLAAAGLLWLRSQPVTPSGAAASGTTVHIVEDTAGTAAGAPSIGGTGSIVTPVLPAAAAPAVATAPGTTRAQAANSPAAELAAKKHLQEKAAAGKAASASVAASASTSATAPASAPASATLPTTTPAPPTSTPGAVKSADPKRSEAKAGDPNKPAPIKPEATGPTPSATATATAPASPALGASGNAAAVGKS